jgi:uncharacterized coiled-coil protein SlyX
MSYTSWKKSVIGKQLNVDGAYGSQCVDLIMAYAEYLFPGHDWPELIGRGNAKDLFSAANPQYFTKIKNDYANVDQLPRQGDILVFGATPQQGFTNKYHNPYGHIGIADSRISASGFNLLQLNAPSSSSPVNVHYYSWRYRPCIGWLRPRVQAKPTPTKPKGDNMATLTTKTDLDMLYQAMLGRPHHGNEGYDVYLNKDYRFVANDLYNSVPGKAYRKQVASQAAKVDSLQKQVAETNKTVRQLQTSVNHLKTELADADDKGASQSNQLKQLKAQVANLTKTNSNLQKQLATTGSDTTNLNALGRLLQWFLVRLGLRS